jgi:ribose/xylose/arabinose/galactoside ABC-type transport system permease subunit
MKSNRTEIVAWLIEKRIFVLVIFFIIVAVLFVPLFATPINLSNLLTQLTIDGVVVIGMTILMVAFGIDLSVGSNLALAGIVYALLVKSGVTIPLAILGAVLVGGVVGLTNGLIVTRLRVNFFIATLATMVAVRGLAITLANEKVVYPGVAGFDWIGRQPAGPIEVPVIVFLVTAIIAHLVLSQTRLGRYWYAIGGNREAAQRVGLKVDRYYVMAFVVTGACAGLAGVLLAARANSASPSVGIETNLIAIAATVIGGTSLYGGIGTIPGAVAGLLLVNILRNALNLLGVSPYYQYLVRGVILIGVVVMDAYFGWRRRVV